MINLIRFFTILIILTTTSCENSQEENCQLVEKLSWDSFTISHNYGTSLELDQNATDLILHGKKCSRSLVEVLNDSTKTIAAHLILTNIWEPEVYRLKGYFYTDCQNMELTIYNLNNLEWIDDLSDQENSVKYTLNKSNVDDIYSYWNNRISN